MPRCHKVTSSNLVALHCTRIRQWAYFWPCYPEMLTRRNSLKMKLNISQFRLFRKIYGFSYYFVWQQQNENRIDIPNQLEFWQSRFLNWLTWNRDTCIAEQFRRSLIRNLCLTWNRIVPIVLRTQWRALKHTLIHIICWYTKPDEAMKSYNRTENGSNEATKTWKIVNI